ncbi:MAG: hypothetical protein Q7T50_02700, partial [Candidatus Magasanikbacteria bacterium]|nr:hypothetical protein [Candidatus Magasanikbacteria bacterium]
MYILIYTTKGRLPKQIPKNRNNRDDYSDPTKHVALLEPALYTRKTVVHLSFGFQSYSEMKLKGSVANNLRGAGPILPHRV